MRIEKAFSLILMTTFLCQNVAFCFPEKNSTLRVPVNGSLRVEEALKRQGPKVEIIKIAYVSIADITIFEVRVDDEEYEISGIAVKRIDLDTETSEEINDPQKRMEIADAVNAVEPRLGEVAQKENWAWWVPNPASNLSPNLQDLKANRENIDSGL